MTFDQLTPSQRPELFDEVARLHMNQIHHGILPLFGQKFLAQLYYELSRTPKTVVWIAAEEGKLLGFLAGCADVGQSLKSVLLRSPLRLMWLASLSILSGRPLRKLPSVFWYPFRVRRSASSERPPEPIGDNAELLAIAVDGAGQGRGIGKRLVALFEDSLTQWGVSDYHVTTNIADPNSNKFYQALLFEPCGQIKHHDLILQKYRKKIVRDQRLIANEK